MARWRLTAKHYLNAQRYGEPTQWVREETNRDTGRTNRKTFIVPLYLDPENAQDQNYPGEIVVAYEGKGAKQQDITFTGPPTPDMEPLDEEATAISEKERPNWIHPIDSLAANGMSYSEQLLEKLAKQLEGAMKAAPTLPNTSAGQVSVEAFNKLMNEVRALSEQNAKLMAQIKSAPPAPVAGRP